MVKMLFLCGQLLCFVGMILCAMLSLSQSQPLFLLCWVFGGFFTFGRIIIYYYEPVFGLPHDATGIFAVIRSALHSNWIASRNAHLVSFRNGKTQLRYGHVAIKEDQIRVDIPGIGHAIVHRREIERFLWLNQRALLVEHKSNHILSPIRIWFDTSPTPDPDMITQVFRSSA